MSYPGIPLYRCVLVREKRTLLVRAKMSSAWQAASITSQLTDDSPVEKLCCIYLDNAMQLIGAEVVATGHEWGVAVTPATVLRGAIIHCAAGIILGHNHPSDDPEPSAADFEMTTTVKRAAAVVDIAVLDHVVVSHSNGHRSMRDMLGDDW